MFSILISIIMAIMFSTNVFGYRFDAGTGHLTVGANIEDKKIEDIINVSKDKVKSVRIEDGVTKICKDAFNRCINLTEITIPDSVTKIVIVHFIDVQA